MNKPKKLIIKFYPPDHYRMTAHDGATVTDVANMSFTALKSVATSRCLDRDELLEACVGLRNLLKEIEQKIGATEA